MTTALHLAPRFRLGALRPGLAGALALTALHEGARRVLPDAPRMDVLGKRGLEKSAGFLGLRKRHGAALYRQALVGDVLSNGLYYSLVAFGRPERPYLRGLLLGALAGVGALVLPPYLGLGRAPSRLTQRTKVLTVAWYTLGGLFAARATRKAIHRRSLLR